MSFGDVATNDTIDEQEHCRIIEKVKALPPNTSLARFSDAINTVGLRRRQVIVNGIAMQEMMIPIYCALSNMRAYQNWCQRTGLGDPNRPLTPEVSNRLAA